MSYADYVKHKKSLSSKAAAPPQKAKASACVPVEGVSNQALLQAMCQNRHTRSDPAALEAAMQRRFQSSGRGLGDVQVHYNSHKPEELDADAYTQGNHVYLGPGKEKYLEHELGHVAQQRMGIVPVQGYRNGLPYNGSPALERQADRMGWSAFCQIDGSVAAAKGVVQCHDPDDAVKKRAYHFWQLRGSPANQTKQEQDEDYYLAESVQRETEQRAYEIWVKKGSPSNQTKDEQDKDYYQAEQQMEQERTEWKDAELEMAKRWRAKQDVVRKWSEACARNKNQEIANATDALYAALHDKAIILKTKDQKIPTSVREEQKIEKEKFGEIRTALETKMQQLKQDPESETLRNDVDKLKQNLADWNAEVDGARKDAIPGDYMYPKSFPFQIDERPALPAEESKQSEAQKRESKARNDYAAANRGRAPGATEPYYETLLDRLPWHYRHNTDFIALLRKPDPAHSGGAGGSDPAHEKDFIDVGRLMEVLTMVEKAEKDGIPLCELSREEKRIDFTRNEGGTSKKFGFDPFRLPSSPELYQKEAEKKAKQNPTDPDEPIQLSNREKSSAEKTYKTHTDNKQEFAKSQNYAGYTALEEIAYSPKHVRETAQAMNEKGAMENPSRKLDVIRTRLPEYYAMEDRWTNHVFEAVRKQILADGSFPVIFQRVQNALLESYPPDKPDLPPEDKIKKEIDIVRSDLKG